ncbi:MAG: class I SAM-dependent methyltransferase [Proteobacteria bacterium]|nr:class I SAM-dependent methyltransferase [Pseudomonadota bacterium]
MEDNRFDRMAAAWDEEPMRLNMAKAVASKILGRIELNTTMTALEIGCGTGLVTVQLAPRLGQVTALDSSENMLAELQKKTQSLDITNITHRKIDLEKDDIPGKSYDLIFSNMTFHHILGGDKLLEKINRALAPGGVLALADLDSEDGSFHGDMPGVHHLGFSRGALVSALERSGLYHCTIEDAHTVERKTTQGQIRKYTLFLATGKKP